MARILLSEADPDVRRLLVLMLGRLGHDVIVLGAEPGVPPPADLLVLEPAAPACIDHARLARAACPGLPILCVSILPDEASFLELGPVLYLAKPFALDDLRVAVDVALASGGCADPDPDPGSGTPERVIARPRNRGVTGTAS